MIFNHGLKAPRSEPCCPTIRSEGFPARLVFGDKTSLVHPLFSNKAVKSIGILSILLPSPRLRKMKRRRLEEELLASKAIL